MKCELQSDITKFHFGETINLRLAIVVLKRKSFKVPNVKKLCDDYKLCFNCKHSPPGITAKICLNKNNTPRSNWFIKITIHQNLIGDEIENLENK